MKKIYTILGISIGILMGSCSDYLNVEKYFKDRMTEEKLFESKDYSEQWLANVYSHLAKYGCLDVCSKEAGVHNFSDDMYYDDAWDGMLEFSHYRNGMYNEGTMQNTWTECYIGIRDASTFIHNIHVNKDLSETEIADYRAQARFLRAYYYWLLLRKYGPIPIIPEDGEMDYTNEYVDLEVPRSSYAECADYIASEMALAAKDLPLTRTARMIAWPTCGAALAVRAKALLYAASPLANGNADPEMATLVDHTGRRLLNMKEEYDEHKWARAAAAAKDVIDLNVYDLYVIPRKYDNSQAPSYPQTILPPPNPEYEKNWPEGWLDIDPFESYRSLFDGDAKPTDNKELIFTRGLNSESAGRGIGDLLSHQVPIEANGKNCHGMTLKQCDAYYMNDGSDMPGKDNYLDRGDKVNPRATGFVTEENQDQYKPLPVGASLQFANREPRFYASVAYSGSIWEMTSSAKEEDRFYQGWYYYGKSDGYKPQSPKYCLVTGIGIKKYYNPVDSYIDGRTVTKVDPAIRYADILLMYAEAMNELTTEHSVENWQGDAYTIRRDEAAMKAAVRPVRVRAGLPNYGNDIYNDADKLRAKIKRERQIEFFAEGQRYYDLRRWMDAPVEEADPIYGYNVYIGEDRKQDFYIPMEVSQIQNVFITKMYFWPISHDELKKNSKLTQNPGWTYYD